MLAWMVFVLVLFAALAALMTYGLERQRRELAGLRREVEAWVASDLQLKRSRMGMTLQADFDHKRWLLSLARRAFPDVLQGTEHLSLEAQTDGAPGVWLHGSGIRVFITPRSRNEIRRLLKAARGRLDAPTVTGGLKDLVRKRPARVSLADDPLLDLAWAEVGRRMGLPEEAPRELFVYVLRRE